MIRDIIIIQKRELEKRWEEPYLERGVPSKKLSYATTKVITGPRRAGKSFFAMHMLRQWKRVGYVNFDDEKLVTIKDYDTIITTVNEVYQDPQHILLDEIQNIQGWELLVNRLQRQGKNLIITGSNAHLLSKELATHLTGRYLPITIFPFSFKEVVASEKKELTTNEIKAKLDTYLIKGGYPEPLFNELPWREYLSTLFQSTIYKDIIKRFTIRSVQGIEDLALYLISNTGKEFSYNTLRQVTRCKSIHTVEKYLYYLEETFLLFKVRRFSFKVKEQIDSNKKMYCIDNGFINARAFQISPDKGKLYENRVAISLHKRQIDTGEQVYYWKNVAHEEVDFVIKEGHRITQLIQVCADMRNPKTKDREIRSLLKASKELACKNLLIITEDVEEEKKETWFGTTRMVQYMPLWKWLIQNG